MTQETMYQHSGKGVAAGVAASLSIAFPALLFLGAVYALAVAFIPIVGYVTFLLASGFGWASAWVVGRILRWSKSRSAALPMVVTVSLVVLAYGFSWVVWTYAFLVRAGVSDIGFVDMMIPWNLLFVLIEIAKVGAWNVMGFTPTGVVLLLLWAVEAVLVIGAAVYGVRRFGMIEPFCEQCNQYCLPETALATMPAVESDFLGDRLLARDFTVIGETFENMGVGFYHVLQSCRCPSCDEMATLSLFRVTPRVDEQGNPNDLIEPVFRHMLVDGSDLQSIDETLATLPPPESDETVDSVADEEQAEAIPA